MATRMKLEVIYTLPDDDVQTEACRLEHYLREFKPVSCGGNDPKPYYDTLAVYAESKEWERVVGDRGHG